MAEDEASTLGGFLSTLAGKKSGSDGVRKDSDGKVNPMLTSNEVARYEKIFGIMKKVVNPGPETGSVDKTAESKVAKTAIMQKVAKETSGTGGDGMFGTIAKLGILGGLIGAALTEMSDNLKATIDDIVQDIVDFGDAAGDGLVKLPVMAAKLAKFIPLKTLKLLPLVGSILSFGFAYQHFQKNEIISGIWELTSGIANLFPGVGTAISIGMDMVKFLYEANAPVNEEGDPIDFGTFIKGKAIEYGSIILDKIKEGKVPMLSGVWKLGEAIGYFIGGDFKSGFKALMNFFPAFLGMGDVEQMYNAMNALYSIVSESEPVAVAKQMANDSWGFMKEAFASIGETLGGFFDGIMNWFDNTIQAAKDYLYDLIPDVLKPGKEKRLKEAQKQAYAAGKRGAASDSIKAIMDRDPEAFAAAKGAGVAEFQSYLKEQGFRKVKDGMIAKNGRVTAFDDQDDLLAAKRGGPIDKMLDGNSATMKSIASINSQQLDVLIQIRDSLAGSNKLAFNNTSLTQEFFE